MGSLLSIVRKVGKRSFHAGAVGIESSATIFCEFEQGLWYLAGEFFLDIDITGFFQFPQMRREIALGQTGLPQEEKEIRTLDHVEVRHDKVPSRFVYDPVNFGYGLVYVFFLILR